MKNETGPFAIEEFVGLKTKMHSLLVDNNSQQQKATNKNDVDKNVVATISHNEHKDFLLNNKCLRHLINEIQSKDHKIETYEIKKISLFCLDDKIYIQINGYGGSSWLSELVI